MVKKLTNNISLKFLSVIFAVLLWLVVLNIDDPVASRTFNGIPVTIKNKEAVTENGKIYEVLDSSDIISIVVKAKRSVLDDLTSSDFVAVADMEELNEEQGTVPISVSIKRYSGKIDEITQKSNNLKVSVEDFVTKQFSITPVYNGEPAAGNVIGETIISPNVIKVSGAKSLVNTVDKVIVRIDVEGMTSDLDLRLVPIMQNAAGETVSSPLLKFDLEDVECKVSLQGTKKVGLNIQVIGSPESGYKFVKLNYSPAYIKIKGDKEALERIESINLDTQILDISGASKNVEKEINVKASLPEGVELAEGENEKVLVTAVIEEMKTKTIEIPTTQVEIKNIPDSLSASITNSVNITVKGDDKVLSSLVSSSIKISVDVSNSEAGTHNYKATVVCPDDVELTEDVYVQVNLTNKSSNGSNNTNNNDL